MTSTTPLCPGINRLGTDLLSFGQALLELLIQTSDDYGRLGGAIGHNPADRIEDTPAVP
jgi:hypothetical protein